MYKSKLQELNNFYTNLNDKYYIIINLKNCSNNEREALIKLKDELEKLKRDDIDKIVMLNINNITNYIEEKYGK